MSTDQYQPSVEDDIRISYKGEMMDNYFTESDINRSQGIQVFMDSQDNVFLLSIDKGNRLQLVAEENGGHWEEQPISKEGIEVSAFAVYCDSSENILRLAYAGKKGESSELLVSEEIDLSKLSPSNIQDLLSWQGKELTDIKRKVDYISLAKDGCVFSTQLENTDASYAYFKYDEEPQVYELPENTEDVIQLEVGTYEGHFGVFILYAMNAGPTMLFKSFPYQIVKKGGSLRERMEGGAPKEEKLHVQENRFSPEGMGRIDAFTTLKDEQGNTVLLLAGDGLYAYGFDGESSKVICPSSEGISFSKLIATRRGEEYSIWAIGQKGNTAGLYYCTNRFYGKDAQPSVGDKWTKPLLMQSSIEDFAAVKGEALLNQLFLLDYDEQSGAEEENQSLSIFHFWQDKKTTMWHKTPIAIKDLNTLKKRESFTLSLSFAARNARRSFHEQELRLSAEASMHVYINQSRYRIGPDHTTTVTLFGNKLDIVYPTKSVAAPALFIEADFLSEKKTIDPATRLKEQIETIMTSEEELRKAKFPQRDSKGNIIRDNNGNPVMQALIEESVSSEDLQKAAQASREALDAWKHRSNVQENTQDTIDGVVGFIGNAAGDVIHAVKESLEEVGGYLIEVVEAGVKLAINIAGEIFEFVASIAADVYHFLERVWDTIKVTFKKLWDLLAFLFEWDDILDTKEAIKGYTNNAIKKLGEELEGVRNLSNNWFNDIKEDLEKWLNDPPSFSHLNDGLGDKEEPDDEEGDDPRAMSLILSNISNLLHIDVAEDLMEILPDEAIDLVNKIWEKLNSIGEELTEDADKFTVDRFQKVFTNGEGLGDILKDLVGAMAKIGVVLAREIIDLLLSLFIYLIERLNDLLNAKIDVPFFSSLYKKVADAELSFLDLISLMIAIPVTSSYKLVEGKAPFSDSSLRTYYIEAGKQVSLIPK